MHIAGLNADWIWQLAQVSVPPKGYGRKRGTEYGSSEYANQVLIENVDGRPALAATDGCMLTAVHATEAACEGLDGSIVLRVEDKLRRALAHVGAAGRWDHTITISDRSGAVAVTVEGPRGDTLTDDQARAAVLKEHRFPAWRRVLPGELDMARAWNRVETEGIGRCNAVNMDLLKKVPQFGSGAHAMQPVWRAKPASETESVNVSVYFVWEAGMENRCLTVVMPMGHRLPLDVPMPFFALPEETRKLREREAKEKEAKEKEESDD